MTMNCRPEYTELLKKYCFDDKLIDLIEECFLDEIGRKEAFYIQYGVYPNKRELLGKLKADLLLTKGAKNGS